MAGRQAAYKNQRVDGVLDGLSLRKTSEIFPCRCISKSFSVINNTLHQKGNNFKPRQSLNLGKHFPSNQSLNSKVRKSRVSLVTDAPCPTRKSIFIWNPSPNMLRVIKNEGESRRAEWVLIVEAQPKAIYDPWRDKGKKSTNGLVIRKPKPLISYSSSPSFH